MKKETPRQLIQREFDGKWELVERHIDFENSKPAYTVVDDYGTFKVNGLVYKWVTVKVYDYLVTLTD